MTTIPGVNPVYYHVYTNIESRPNKMLECVKTYGGVGCTISEDVNP